MPKSIPLDKVEVWFQDEARVGQQGTKTRIFAEKGTRPRVIKQQQFLYAYIFGAVCPQTGKTAALVLPELNSKTMQLHLDLISSEIQEGKHAVLICDQASWHVTQKLKLPKNLSCLSLPPYSPELNPMEQVWHYLRQHNLANRCFDGYNAILNACCCAWNNFT